MNRRKLLLGTAAAAAVSRLSLASPTPGFTALSGRPPQSERHFRSPAVERAIEQMHRSVGCLELALMFENCFPNTLDTTVFPTDLAGKPDTYVITGDIDAMWLRDSSAQMWPYLPFVKQDAALGRLIEGVIRRQARLVQIDPYANAFTRSVSDPPLAWAVHDETEMRSGVAERKWEIDSLCFAVRLAHGYWKETGSTVPFDGDWLKSAKLIVATFREQQRRSGQGPYSFQRKTLRPTGTLALGGYGNPIKPNGLVCSAFRPSDDACTYLFFVPANLFAALTLERLADMAAVIYLDHAFALECKSFAADIRDILMRYASVHHSVHGEILAYEIDGFGNALCMDDANAPSLLSLAYLELLPISSPLYRRTRSFVLSSDNPYFFRGSAGEGIGGPHVGLGDIWPMSVIMRALTSVSEQEIVRCLQILCTTTAGTDFMHESFQKNDPSKYTRPWFAWANGLFGELLLKLQRERPALLQSFRITG
jgi:meiotically up-regulated gene 157 (Mug157) protein